MATFATGLQVLREVRRVESLCRRAGWTLAELYGGNGTRGLVSILRCGDRVTLIERERIIYERASGGLYAVTRGAR